MELSGLQKFKVQIMRKLILLSCVVFLFLNSFAQTDVVEFLKGGKADANALIKAYLNPYATAFGVGLNNGWYNSAKVHKLGGFDFSITVSAIQIPEGAQSFDLNKIGLQKLTLENPTNHMAPTVAGQKGEGPKLIVRDSDGSTAFSFTTPGGVGLDIVPVPMVQLGFGLLPHTDVIGRFVPEMKYDNNGDKMKIGFWGIGVKHNFMEWIPVLKELPFDASVFFCLSEVDGQSALSFTPEDYGEPSATVDYNNTSDQFLNLKTKTTRYGLILSKKIGVLTIFGGLGQSKSETSIDLLGKYPVLTEGKDGLEINDDNAIYDPVAVSFNSKGFCMDAGLRLKLGFFSLFGSINRSEYTSYTTGISLGFR